MDPLRRGASWQLSSTVDQTSERIQSLARSRSWTVTWRDNRFAISEPYLNRTLQLVSGVVSATDGGSRLEARAGSLLYYYSLMAAVSAISAFGMFVDSSLLPAGYVLVAGCPLWALMTRSNWRKQAAALRTLEEAFAEVRCRPTDGPFR